MHWEANSATGIRAPLSNNIWEALANYAGLECRMICENVVNLPRELRDVIYNILLDNISQSISPGGLYSSESSWRDSLPHLNASVSGQAFLHEFMSLYYSRTSFKLSYKIRGRWAPGDLPIRRPGMAYYRRSVRLPSAEKQSSFASFNAPLWTLLSRDSFGSTHAPATLIDKIEISIPNDYTLWGTPSPVDLLEVAEDATPIEDSKVKVLIAATYYRYLAAKSCCKRPTRLEPKIHVKDLLRRLEPALTRLTELGVDVQLDYSGSCSRSLYPSSSVLTDLREEQAAFGQLQCRESSRPGLRKLGGVRKKYA
ncbi:hypothetical protein DE146DRAFT_184559 [Phaeosphaeria sp. MPI-PUGE-AT-0046c]|nr:hypothetical protein DE146DRAFT_184559 [Phaeosphaeria sp. MPI-PUGE-AT-0046c]